MIKSNIVKGAVISYVSIFLNIVISFFYTPWMIKQIGVSDYGLYSLVYSFISYFIMDFGLSKAITRFIAKYRAEDNVQMVSNMLGLTTKAYLIIDSVIFLVLFVLYFFISDIFISLTPEELDKLKILYCIAAVFSVLSFMFRPLDGAMTAFEFFVENKTIDIIQRVGTVVLICVALYFHGGVYLLVLINGAAALLTSIVKYIVFRRKSTTKINWHYNDKQDLKDIFSFSIWSFGRGLAQRFRFALVPSVLGIFCNTTEISIFSLGITLEATVYTMCNAINGLFLPKISKLSHNNERSTIMDLMVRVGRIELFITVFIFSAFCIFGQQFITLWVGDTFYEVYWIVIFLIFSNLIIYTEDTAENLVFVENQIKYTTTIIFICSALGLIGSCIFAKRFGALGCAACSGFALFLDTIIVNVFYHKKMSLDIPSFFKQCHLKIMPFCIIVSVLFFFAYRHLALQGWIPLILAGCVYTVLFFGSLYIFVFNKEEKQLIKAFVTRQ